MTKHNVIKFFKHYIYNYIISMSCVCKSFINREKKENKIKYFKKIFKLITTTCSEK